MENYELSCEDIKQIDKVSSQIRELKNELEGKSTEQQGSDKQGSDKTEQQGTNKTDNGEEKTDQSTNLSETDLLFYEINDKKVILKMDVVKDYLNKIKDKEWSDLKSDKPAAWIMAVQIALRCPKICGLQKDKYGEIVIDGVLGPKTKEAVEKFQTEYKLNKIDGLPGKETMNKIYSILTGFVTIGTGTDGNNESGETAKKEDNSDGENGNNTSGNDSGETVKKEDNSVVATGSSIETKENEPKDTDLVSIEKYIPSIKLDMRYATTNNFTGQKIYNDADAKLRYGTIKKLKNAQEELSKKGYSIKIWDAYRPQSAQEKLWSIRPDPALVANPKKGSAHTKGNTVDITLVKSDGSEIPMPSEFDDNNKKKIDRDYSDLSNEQKNNAKILEDAMKEAGFVGYTKEWRHYTDSKDYPMEKKD